MGTIELFCFLMAWSCINSHCTALYLLSPRGECSSVVLIHRDQYKTHQVVWLKPSMNKFHSLQKAVWSSVAFWDRFCVKSSAIGSALVIWRAWAVPWAIRYGQGCDSCEEPIYSACKLNLCSCAYVLQCVLWGVEKCSAVVWFHSHRSQQGHAQQFCWGGGRPTVTTSVCNGVIIAEFFMASFKWSTLPCTKIQPLS